MTKFFKQERRYNWSVYLTPQQVIEIPIGANYRVDQAVPDIVFEDEQRREYVLFVDSNGITIAGQRDYGDDLVNLNDFVEFLESGLSCDLWNKGIRGNKYDFTQHLGKMTAKEFQVHQAYLDFHLARIAGETHPEATEETINESWHRVEKASDAFNEAKRTLANLEDRITQAARLFGGDRENLPQDILEPLERGKQAVQDTEEALTTAQLAHTDLLKLQHANLAEFSKWVLANVPVVIDQGWMEINTHLSAGGNRLPLAAGFKVSLHYQNENFHTQQVYLRHRYQGDVDQDTLETYGLVAKAPEPQEPPKIKQDTVMTLFCEHDTEARLTELDGCQMILILSQAGHVDWGDGVACYVPANVTRVRLSQDNLETLYRVIGDILGKG